MTPKEHTNAKRSNGLTINVKTWEIPLGATFLWPPLYVYINIKCICIHHEHGNKKSSISRFTEKTHISFRIGTIRWNNENHLYMYGLSGSLHHGLPIYKHTCALGLMWAEPLDRTVNFRHSRCAKSEKTRACLTFGQNEPCVSMGIKMTAQVSWTQFLKCRAHTLDFKFGGFFAAKMTGKCPIDPEVQNVGSGCP